mgnify:CR=1 FL=1
MTPTQYACIINRYGKVSPQEALDIMAYRREAWAALGAWCTVAALCILHVVDRS